VLQEDLAQSRRSDWLETHKKDIQMDIGCDPANEWEYEDADEVESQPVSVAFVCVVYYML
jgi:hypothetical protein